MHLWIEMLHDFLPKVRLHLMFWVEYSISRKFWVVQSNHDQNSVRLTISIEIIQQLLDIICNLCYHMNEVNCESI
jgi:hypothetical protein